MGIRIESEQKREWASLKTVNPGDTFELLDNLGDFFLVTNKKDKDDEMLWEIVNLRNGKMTSIDDDERIILVNLVVTKER